MVTTIFAHDMMMAGRELEWHCLAGGFRELRQRLRLKFAGDVRCNDKLMKVSTKFIKTWMRTHPPQSYDEVEILEPKCDVSRIGNTMTGQSHTH